MPDDVEGAPYTLGDRVLRMEVESRATTETLRALNATVAVIGERMNGRPSWPVVTFLTLSVAANSVLATALFSVLSHR